MTVWNEGNPIKECGACKKLIWNRCEAVWDGGNNYYHENCVPCACCDAPQAGRDSHGDPVCKNHLAYERF